MSLFTGAPRRQVQVTVSSLSTFLLLLECVLFTPAQGPFTVTSGQRPPPLSMLPLL